jgi:hypothetical protein
MRIFGLLLLVLTALSAPAQSYSIDWHKISGGGGTSTNGQYSVSGTIGQPDAGGAMSGPVTGTNYYSVTGGFWSLISVVQTLGAPALAVTHSGNNVIVSWPSPATGFQLQQNSNLTTTNWTATGFSISDDGTNKSITISSPTGNLFFRLKQ